MSLGSLREWCWNCEGPTHDLSGGIHKFEKEDPESFEKSLHENLERLSIEVDESKTLPDRVKFDLPDQGWTLEIDLAHLSYYERAREIICKNASILKERAGGYTV